MFHFRFLNALYARAFRLVFASRFKHFGHRTSLVFPAGIEGAQNISIGDDVYIAKNTYLAAMALTNEQDCTLEIGSGSKIGRFNHIFATHRVILGKNTLTANGVYISDNLHEYRDAQIPILHQPIRQNGIVEIGEGSWLGHNACVLGASIGKHCVIGANSVVTKDIPDYCVAVGAPAKIIRRYDSATKTWRNTSPNGDHE